MGLAPSSSWKNTETKIRRERGQRRGINSGEQRIGVWNANEMRSKLRFKVGKEESFRPREKMGWPGWQPFGMLTVRFLFPTWCAPLDLSFGFSHVIVGGYKWNIRSAWAGRECLSANSRKRTVLGSAPLVSFSISLFMWGRQLIIVIFVNCDAISHFFNFYFLFFLLRN